MSSIVYADPSVFIVVTGSAYAGDLVAPDNGAWEGLIFRQEAPKGAIDLAITAPRSLVDFADLASAAILKPVALPISLTGFRHGVIDCALRDEMTARRVSQRILAALAADTHPVPGRRCNPPVKRK